MRVFLDTNIWVSAIAAAGLCEALVKALFASHELLGSELVWDALSSVLVRKLGFSSEELAEARALFEEVTLVPDAPATIEDNDARLVASASLAGADLFVTGDQRVLGWGASDALRIVTPREAWTICLAPDPDH